MARRSVLIIGEPKIPTSGPLSERTKANGTITPGMLVEVGNGCKVIPHETAGGTSARMFAIEDDHQGLTMDDDYTTGQAVHFGTFKPGDELLAILADGETITAGDLLESNGDGYLRKVDTDASAGDIAVQSVVGFSLTSTTSASGVTSRIHIEII